MTTTTTDFYRIPEGTAREVLTEGNPVLLGLKAINDLIWAIQLAYSRIDDDKAMFAATAATLRSGVSVPLFAEGEQGASAIDEIIRSFDHGKERLGQIMDLLVDCDSMIAIDLSGDR